MSTEAAGGVLTAKQAPHRPGTVPAHGLRAENDGAPIVLQTALQREKAHDSPHVSPRPVAGRFPRRPLHPERHARRPLGPRSAHDGGPHAARVAHDGPEATAGHRHAVPISIAFQCTADVNTLRSSVTGFSTHLGHWTAEGDLDVVQVDPAADRVTLSGTITIATANGDQLFVSFTPSWQISTGQGTDSITITGGTGRFAGATGSATLDCTVTADPASPSTFHCDCTGTGVLLLPSH